MKYIITENQLKKLAKGQDIDENILGALFKNTSKGVKNFVKGVKNIGKPVTKSTVTKPLIDTLEHIKLQKNNLIKKGIKVLNQNELPKKFYHGSSKKITMSDLTTSAAEKSRVKNYSTGSSGMDGMYFSENLWDNMSQHNKFTNPVYKQNSNVVGAENAERYAQQAIKNKQKGYIYEMELTPEAVIIPDKSISGINTARITNEDMEKLLSMGIDGIYKSDIEIVILNRRAIKSFNQKYVGDKFVGKTTKTPFGDKIPAEGSFGFNWKPI